MRVMLCRYQLSQLSREKEVKPEKGITITIIFLSSWIRVFCWFLTGRSFGRSSVVVVFLRALAVPLRRTWQSCGTFCSGFCRGCRGWCIESRAWWSNVRSWGSFCIPSIWRRTLLCSKRELSWAGTWKFSWSFLFRWSFIFIIFSSFCIMYGILACIRCRLRPTCWAHRSYWSVC